MQSNKRPEEPAGHSLSRIRCPFTIPKGIAANFKIVGNLSRAEEWRAKVLKGNSGDIKVGAWDSVGYIMISTDSRSIIPIARCDEHHCGFEVLREVYFRRRLVPKENYVPVFAFGLNYVWSESVNEMREACRRFRAYGGGNSIVKGADSRYIGTLDDLIRGNGGGGALSVDMSALSPVGKYIIGKLEAVAKGVVGRKRDVFPVAHDFIQWVFFNRYAFMRVMDFGTDELPRWEKDVLRAEAEGDFDLLARPFFTMDGLKNRLHNRIRKVVQGPKDDYAKEVAGEFWGNLDVALSEFSRLSQI